MTARHDGNYVRVHTYVYIYIYVHIYIYIPIVPLFLHAGLVQVQGFGFKVRGHGPYLSLILHRGGCSIASQQTEADFFKVLGHFMGGLQFVLHYFGGT